MTEKSVLMRPQSLRPRALALLLRHWDKAFNKIASTFLLWSVDCLSGF